MSDQQLEGSMNWPVKILNEVEDVKKLKWGIYFTFFLVLCAILAFVIGGVKYFNSDYFESQLSVFIFSYGVIVVVFMVFLSLKAYIYSVKLTVYEACKAESERIKQQWVYWASQKINISGYRFFFPDIIDIKSSINDSLFDVYTAQSLVLKEGQGGIYTESDIYTELLSSVRAVIKEIEEGSSFRIIFIDSINPLSLSFFKLAWLGCGFREEKIVSHAFFSSELWDDFLENVGDGVDDNVTIVLSINLSNMTLSSNDSTEFASLNIISANKSCKMPSVVFYRPISCAKEDLNESLLMLMTYQPDICLAQVVTFSGVAVEDVALISNQLKSTAQLLSMEWGFSVKELSMVFGNQDDKHVWLSLCYLSDVCKVTNKRQLMISRYNNAFIFVLVAPWSADVVLEVSP